MSSTPIMHELAICQSILTQAAAIAARHGGARVASVTVRIGPLAGVEPALLRAAFPLAAAGTCCAAASLHIAKVDVRVKCKLCGAASEVRPNRLICGICRTWHVMLLEGDEMRLEFVELLDEETANV